MSNHPTVPPLNGLDQIQTILPNRSRTPYDQHDYMSQQIFYTPTLLQQNFNHGNEYNPTENSINIQNFQSPLSYNDVSPLFNQSPLPYFGDNNMFFLNSPNILNTPNNNILFPNTSGHINEPPLLPNIQTSLYTSPTSFQPYTPPINNPKNINNITSINNIESASMIGKSKSESLDRSSTSSTNENENKDAFVPNEEDIKNYEELMRELVTCFDCGQRLQKIKCFIKDGKYICCGCSGRISNRKTLGDWEIEEENGVQCKRLNHHKNHVSYMKKQANGTFKIETLCMFCRNMKSYEYYRKQYLSKSG